MRNNTLDISTNHAFDRDILPLNYIVKTCIDLVRMSALIARNTDFQVQLKFDFNAGSSCGMFLTENNAFHERLMSTRNTGSSAIPVIKEG